MEEKSPSPASVKRRNRLLQIAAIAFLSLILAVFAILRGIDVNRLKPIITQAVRQETGRDLEIRGAIDLHLGLSPSFFMEDILLQNAPWASRPEMVRIKRLEVKIALLPLLKKDLRITRLLLVEPDILLETDRAGTWNVEFEKAKPGDEKQAFSKGLDLSRVFFHQVDIEKGRVTYRDGATGKAHPVAIGRFTMSSEGVETPIALAFRGSYKDSPFELTGRIGSFLAVSEAGKGYPVDLALKAIGSELKVQGTVTDTLNLKGLALKASAQLRSTSEIAKTLGLNIPAACGPLRFSAEISDPGEKTYALSDVRISHPAGEVRGNLLVSFGRAHPSVSGTLASEKLNLQSYWSPGKGTQTKGGTGAPNTRIFPSDPLPLAILKAVDVQLKIHADQMQLPRLSLATLRMEAALQDGSLVVKPITFRIAGGEAEGRVEMRPQGKEALVKAFFKVNEMDLRLLSPDFKAEGKVEVQLDLLASGSSIAGLMAGLKGRTVVVMGQGRVDNKTIGILGGDLASGVFQILHPSSKNGSYTDIRCGVSGFEIQDGIAKVTALLVDTPELSVMGEGEVNLRDETLDLSLKPYPKGGAAGFTLSLGELAKSFKLGGTLASPSLQMDTAQSMIAAGKAAGGVLLFGPGGILAALAGQSSRDKNPCLSAIYAAKKGTKALENHKEEARKPTGDKGITGTLKGIGESMKSVFSRGGSQNGSERPPPPYVGAGP